MKYIPSPWAIVIFLAFVIAVFVISYYFARRTRSSEGYFAAGGNIHWSVNGIAFAGDYLSAASFLGICGLIAVAGYDGFLYSIGYLAGWIMALFVVAEPMKRLGKFTFADALDSKFKSRGIRLIAAISTLIVSMFYLIPQMVGAGSLVTPLLGLPHWAGVLMVGSIVIIIVATAGMASTTYVQFLKGGLLVIFSLVLVIAIMSRGFSTAPDQGGQTPFHDFKTIEAEYAEDDQNIILADSSYEALEIWNPESDLVLAKLKDTSTGFESIWKLNQDEGLLEETLTVTQTAEGQTLYNGGTRDEELFYQVGHMSLIDGQTDVETGSLGIFSFFSTIKDSTVVRWSKQVIADGDDSITVYYQNPTPGREVLRPGLVFKVDSDKGATATDKVDFASLMLALFFGTAALPHILIRYYTVPTPACARKSTIVAIAVIGFFYILTLFIGLGAMTGGVVDITNNNMSAPLLARSFGIGLFAIISAIAFATVLGTVSGLIVASSGAVAHDLMDKFLKIKMSDKGKVLAGKISAIVVGCIAMVLGVVFKGMNVSYLVGWAFAIAASSNLPAILMILFWKKTTAKGVIASVLVGLISSVTLILLSQKTFNEVYHLSHLHAPVQINNPAIISVPLSFLTLVIVSLITRKSKMSDGELESQEAVE
jgi:cation/acetate symporter